MENRLKQKLAAGETLFGVIAPNRDATLAETIGLLGFDYYMIDAEHGPSTPLEAELLARACELGGAVPLARIRAVDAKLILQFLDAGVMGVMMPGIESAAQVEELVAAVKYPPLGKRGLGPVRAARFMLGKQSQAEYVEAANKATLVLPQIESLAAVDALESILDVPGVDGVIVGPRDLAMSMGYSDGPNHEAVKQVINRIFKTVIAKGKVLGTVAGTAEQARKLREQGVRIVLNSVTGLLKAAAKPFLAARDEHK